MGVIFGMLSHFGYLDPGTGSVIIQAIIGLVAGISLFGRRAIKAIASRIKFMFKRTSDSKR